MRAFTLAAFLAVSACGGHPAFAADGDACPSFAQLQHTYPGKPFIKFTPDQEYILRTFSEHGHPAPAGISQVYVAKTVGDPNSLALFAYNAEGCYKGGIQIPIAAVPQMFPEMPAGAIKVAPLDPAADEDKTVEEAPKTGG